jgi:hypothetical protein
VIREPRRSVVGGLLVLLGQHVLSELAGNEFLCSLLRGVAGSEYPRAQPAQERHPCCDSCGIGGAFLLRLLELILDRLR